MHRWQEEWEIKQADFMRCIHTFHKMSDVWSALAKSSLRDSHAVYARKKAIMFAEMAQRAQDQFNDAGYAHRVLEEGKILADYIQIDREHPDNIIPQLLLSPTVRHIDLPSSCF
jgi:hypothetical protein